MSTATLIVRSPAFEHEGTIPVKYTCDGDNMSPPIAIDNIPEKTVSLVLFMEDPDAPGNTWDHWIVFNIPPETSRIGSATEPIGTSGVNSWGTLGYAGPCPPQGTHRYLIRIYALKTWLRIPEGSTKQEIRSLMRGHILESTTLMGHYTRTQHTSDAHTV